MRLIYWKGTPRLNRYAKTDWVGELVTTPEGYRQAIIKATAQEDLEIVVTLDGFNDNFRVFAERQITISQEKNVRINTNSWYSYFTWEGWRIFNNVINEALYALEELELEDSPRFARYGTYLEMRVGREEMYMSEKLPSNVDKVFDLRTKMPYPKLVAKPKKFETERSQGWEFPGGSHMNFYPPCEFSQFFNAYLVGYCVPYKPEKKTTKSLTAIEKWWHETWDWGIQLQDEYIKHRIHGAITPEHRRLFTKDPEVRRWLAEHRPEILKEIADKFGE